MNKISEDGTKLKIAFDTYLSAFNYFFLMFLQAHNSFLRDEEISHFLDVKSQN